MSDEEALFLVYMTVSGANEAATIARTLVDERLAACANVFGPVRSFYRWEGKVQDEAEHVLFAKTTGSRLEALTARAVELHSYTLPCIVAVPIDGGNPPFLEWVVAETEGEEGS